MLATRFAATMLCCFCLASFAAADVTLYATGAGPGGNLFRIDIDTGAATAVGPAGGSAFIHSGGLAYDPFNDVLYATGSDNSVSAASSLWRLDQATGAATKIGDQGSGINLSSGGLAFDTNTRTLYATGSYGIQSTGLYTLDTTTGAATLVGSNGLTSDPIDLYGLGFDATTDTLYANGYNLFAMGQSTLYTVNTATGRATVVGHHGVTQGRQLFYGGLAFHPTTHVLYSLGSITGSSSGLYTVDPFTGDATLVGPAGAYIGLADGGLVFATPVPEPTALSVIAPMALLVMRRRR